MSARRRPASKASAPDPFAGQMAARMAQIAAEDAADDAARREHVGDLAWVTRERDELLESVRLFARMLAELGSASDPEARAFAEADTRRNFIAAGRDSIAKGGGHNG